MTEAESRLWSRLRNRAFFGFKFVRQLPVGRYVADFACREADLVIEIDGGQHAGSTCDERRTAVLLEYGYRVIRFWNNEVLQNTDGVLKIIHMELEKAPSPGLRYAPADLSPQGEVNPTGASLPSDTPVRVSSSLLLGERVRVREP